MIETINSIKLTSKSQLVDYFEKGNKQKSEWGIGTEHEKFLCHKDGFGRLSYDSEPGIKRILEHLMKTDWEPIFENGNLIGLKNDGASISLEPGGQYELSGKNIKTIHHTYEETKRHFDELKEISKKFNVVNLALGFDPLWKRDEMNWMPKERYKFMRKYMPTKGKLGLDMMTRTATIQVNLDYQDEVDMIKKMRVAQAIQPIATALFANSPFSEGKPNGYLSYRSHVWDDTDPDRCGFLSFIFDDDFGFERWTDYLLDVPMYFIYRDGEYIPSANITFRQFMEGKHHLQPLMTDWETHVSTVFPDVRLKQFIEMRGADASCCTYISALSAFWVGLLYDDEALNCVSDYIKDWSVESIQEIRAQVPKFALNAEFQNLSVKNIARDLINISSGGLERRKLVLGIEDESKYLEPIARIAETGKTQAEMLLDAYYNKWNKNICAVLKNHC